MKKINVKKLVELKKKELENIKQQRQDWEWQMRGYTVTRGEALAEQLRGIRTEFAAESVKLFKAIKAAEGRATARTIDVNDLIEALVEIDSYLSISKKAMKGTTVSIDCNAQKFPSAYKWTPESTIFYAEFGVSGWSVIEIEREQSRTKKYRLTMSETAKAEYLKKAETLGE